MMSAMRVWTFGNQFGGNGPGFNAANLRRLGWIPADRIWSHTGNFACQTISLAALSEPDAKGYLMASITGAAEGGAKTEYVIEFRRKRVGTLAFREMRCSSTRCVTTASVISYPGARARNCCRFKN